MWSCLHRTAALPPPPHAVAPRHPRGGQAVLAAQRRVAAVRAQPPGHHRVRPASSSSSRGRNQNPVLAVSPDVPVSSTSWFPAGSTTGTRKVIDARPSASAVAVPSWPRLREGSDAVTRSPGANPVLVTVTRSARNGRGALIAAVAATSIPNSVGLWALAR